MAPSWAKSMRLLVNGDFVHLSNLPPKPPGMVQTLQMIYNYEGPKKLFSGLVPGLHRQMCFASIRIGLYDEMKAYYQNLLGNGKQSIVACTCIFFVSDIHEVLHCLFVQ